MTIALDRATIRPHTSLEELRSRLTGEVHTPDDEQYAALSTPWLLAVPMRPAAVVAVRTAEDVSPPSASPGNTATPSASRPPATGPTARTPDTCSW